jgi:hypothetical protein
VATRGLYKAADGSWRQADASTGVRLLYRLKEHERWTLLDKDRAMVVHPIRPPKIVYPDGACRRSPQRSMPSAVDSTIPRKAALAELLRRTIAADPFPMSPRVRQLRAILAKLTGAMP